MILEITSPTLGQCFHLNSQRLELVAGAHFAFFQNREIEPSALALQESLDDVGTSETNAEFVTGHARFSDHHLGGANAKLVTNVRFCFQQAFGRKVLAEHAPRQIHLWKLAFPKIVVLRGIDIDGFAWASMN